MKQFLLVLCGIPASGKSMLANELSHQLNQYSQVEVVSTDNWRDDAYYSNFSPENETQVRITALKETESFLSIDKSIIHDDTNYYTSMRHELYDLARLYECVFAVVHISTPLEIALEWNLRRETIIPEHVIRRIHDKLDSPGTKYSWDKPIAKVDLSSVGTSQAARDIIHDLEKLEPSSFSKPDSGETIHSLRDKLTRLVISRFLRENPSFRNDNEVHRIRKAILQDAKKNNLSIEDTNEQLEFELRKLATRTS
jgi:O-phosphoseryl-tRNA(Sec) kinase